MPTPQLSKTAAPKPRNITKADIELYLALQAQRKEANRQAYLLSKQTDALGTAIEAFLLAKAPGKTRSIDRSGYRLSIVDKPGSVSWKAEFVNALGQHEADKLAAAAPPREELQIEKL